MTEYPTALEIDAVGSVPDYPRMYYMLHEFGDLRSKIVENYAHKPLIFIYAIQNIGNKTHLKLYHMTYKYVVMIITKTMESSNDWK